jgi:hypothetical protein
MTKQEENWELMTILQIPWSESAKITDEEDRKFLLGKANELKQAIINQQKQQQTQSQIITGEELFR